MWRAAVESARQQRKSRCVPQALPSDFLQCRASLNGIGIRNHRKRPPTKLAEPTALLQLMSRSRWFETSSVEHKVALVHSRDLLMMAFFHEPHLAWHIVQPVSELHTDGRSSSSDGVTAAAMRSSSVRIRSSMTD